MFNNAVLDVAIGLIFIFLLYSLLASIVNEFVATIFAYRHRMLEKALEQMLDGKNYSYYWWDKLLNNIKWLSVRKKIKENYKKNLLPGTKLSRKDFLSNKAINDKDSTTIDKGPFYVRRAKLNKKAELFASNIVNHALYRRKSEDSFLFKKPAYLGAGAFSDILIDVLSDRKCQRGAEPVVMNDIKKFVNEQLHNNCDLRDILNLYIEQANGDLQRFKVIIESWFDDTMNRVSGWYKRQASKVLLAIGFILAMIFRVDTIQIVDKLSKDKTARAALVQNASDYIKKSSEASLNQNTATIPATTSAANPPKGAKLPPADSIDSVNKSKQPVDTTQARDSLLKKARQQLEDMKKLYNEYIEENNTIVGLGWAKLEYADDSVRYNKMRIRFMKDSSDYANELKKDPKYEGKAPKAPLLHEPRSIFKTIGFVLRKSFSSPLMLLGFLLTAFAVSLGSPFWFDLLNKFVNIRVSGKKPEPATGGSGSKTASLNQKPDPTAKG